MWESLFTKRNGITRQHKIIACITSIYINICCLDKDTIQHTVSCLPGLSSKIIWFGCHMRTTAAVGLLVE